MVSCEDEMTGVAAPAERFKHAHDLAGHLVDDPGAYRRCDARASGVRTSESRAVRRVGRAALFSTHPLIEFRMIIGSPASPRGVAGNSPDFVKIYVTSYLGRFTAILVGSWSPTAT